jgi:hypothetical protein
MLLAKMREPRAYPSLVTLISYEDNKINYLWDDLILDNYAPILRDTFNGDKSLLPPLMENRSISPWSRIAAIEAYGMHYHDGHISREEITGCLRRLIHETYTGQPDLVYSTEPRSGVASTMRGSPLDDNIVFSGIASCIRNHQLSELLADVKGLFDRGCINKAFFKDYDNYIERYNNTPDHKLFDIHIDDPIELMNRSGLFQDNSSNEDEDLDYHGKKDDNDFDDNDDDDEEDEDKPVEKPRRVIKIGRNEPCPCGSGKKYKNCCMDR